MAGVQAWLHVKIEHDCCVRSSDRTYRTCKISHCTVYTPVEISISACIPGVKQTIATNLLFMYWHARNQMCQHRCALVLHHIDTHNAICIPHILMTAINTEAYMCRVCPNITVCVRRSIDSRNRTIHNACHISLHVSSSTEPTHQSRHM
jgi:hypothetical protein